VLGSWRSFPESFPGSAGETQEEAAFPAHQLAAEQQRGKPGRGERRDEGGKARDEFETGNVGANHMKERRHKKKAATGIPARPWGSWLQNY